MAFSSIAALAAGTVETATVLGAMTEIGIASTVVGAVTGSKDLMKFGGALSLVGGVGGMINGAIESAGAAAANSASDAAMTDLADSVATDTAATVGSAAETAATAEGLASTVVDSGADGIVNGLEGAGNDSIMNVAQQEAGTNPFADKTLPANDVSQATTQATTSAPSATTSTTDLYQGAAKDSQQAWSSGNAYAGGPANSQTFFKSMLNWIEQNPRQANFFGQLGAGALKGMSDSSIADKQIAAKNRETDLHQYGSQVAKVNPRSIINSVRA